MRFPILRRAGAALILALSVAQPASALPLDEALFIEVQALAADGEFAAADAELVQALAEDSAALPDARLAALDLLAELRTQAGDLAGAAAARNDALDYLKAREDADSPALAPLYTAAGEAYLAAADYIPAIEAFNEALVIDDQYLPCDSPVLGHLHGRLAAALEGAGEAQNAAFQRELAEDPDLRCEEAGESRGRGDGRTADADGDFVEVDVHFATDRAPTGDPRPESFYGPDRGTLAYGVATVTIPHSHRPGQIESPSFLRFEWRANPSRHIILASIETVDRDGFFNSMHRQMGEDGGKEVFVFVHGYNVTFTAAAKRAAQMAYDLNFDGVPVLFSWPSRGRTGGYLADAAVVQLSGRRLLGFLQDIIARSEADHIHLIAHSMGNRAMTEALELLALSRGPDAPAPFDQIIFAAPDVDAGLFAEQLPTIAPLAERVTLYTSDADLALEASRKLHGNAPRAGQGGEDTMVTDLADSIDMTVIGDDMLKHSYFANDSSALTDILWLFWRNEPPEDRCGMVEKQGEDGSYWAYVAEACEGDVLLSALTLARQGGSDMLSRLDARIEAARDAVSESELSELLQIRSTLAELLSR